MQLSNEDNLRLNVLMAQSPKAIRINESAMILYALTTRGEAKIHLNSTGKDEPYLRLVREFLSLKVTGSTGGYPMFIRRWTRMGHTKNNPHHMLLLGEPEAIAAVVYAQKVSNDIAECAWWAYPSAEHARLLLAKENVAKSALGKELSQYLIEFLPFEAIQLHVVETLRLCLQYDLMDDKKRLHFWRKAKRKNPYYVAFLHSSANRIPINKKSHRNYENISSNLKALVAINNIYAVTLCHILDIAGQKWLETLKLSLKKPVDQEVVISIFLAIQHYFQLPFPEQRGIREISTAINRSEALCIKKGSSELQPVINLLNPQQLLLFKALLILTQLGEDSLNIFFGGNDSVGTVMRKRLQPLTDVITKQINRLLE